MREILKVDLQLWVLASLQFVGQAGMLEMLGEADIAAPVESHSGCRRQSELGFSGFCFFFL